MTDRGPLYDQNETPEDVATLYSWANLHGAKYRDFSASRAQTREKARLRVQQAIEEEQARAQQLAGAEHPAEINSLADLERAAETRRLAEQARVEEEAHIAELAAQQAAHEAAQQAACEAADKAAREAGEQAARQAAELKAREAAEEAARQAAAEAARKAAEQAARLAAEQAARQAAEQAAQEIARRAAQLAARQQAEKEAEQAARAAAEKAAQQLAEQRAAQEAELQATRQAAEKAAQQLAAQRAALQAQAAKDAAERAAEQAARQAEQQAARQAAEQAAQKRAAQDAAQRAAQEAAERLARQQAQAERLAATQAGPAPTQPAATPYLPKRDYPGYTPPQPHVPIQGQPQPAAMREESYPLPHNPWGTSDQHEQGGRPAWLMPDRPEAAGHHAVPPAPEDTLQGSRDRLASRWYALRGVFEGAGSTTEAAPVPAPARAPVVAVFSLAGGVGKTSLVATLGRALSARGERVLLVDTAPYGLLPFFFGARDQRPGLLRTFSPPGNSGDAPIQMVTIDPEGLGPDTGNQDALTAEIGTYSRGAGRVIVDLATASGATTRRILRMTPLVVVPLIPDMNSVVSFTSIDSFFQHNGSAQAKPPLPYYVLNQFDASLPLHLDIREVLREQLGDRLLPFVLRRAPSVSEALAEGMTVMDYAPNSTVAEDFGSLAGWVKSQSAAASSTYRGVRWSER
jgi:cellulose synthase operon protein YhjQ